MESGKDCPHYLEMTLTFAGRYILAMAPSFSYFDSQNFTILLPELYRDNSCNLFSVKTDLGKMRLSLKPSEFAYSIFVGVVTLITPAVIHHSEVHSPSPHLILQIST